MNTFYKSSNSGEEIYEYIQFLENDKAEYQRWSVCDSNDGKFYYPHHLQALSISDMTVTNPNPDYKFQK